MAAGERRTPNIVDRRMRKAVPWVLLEGLVNAAAGIAMMIVIGRLIGPAEYGRAIAAVSIILLIELMSSFGITEALVQRKDLSRGTLDTAFWTALGLGVCGTLTAFAVAPAVVAVYGDPSLFDMVAVYGISPILTGIAAIPLGLLIRKMRAHVLFARTLISKGTSVAVGILLASLGFGAWSIILGLLAGSVAAGIGLWLTRRYVPALRFDVGEFRRIAKFGGLFSLDAFIATAAIRLGLFLIGAINGYAVLGFFAFALRIVDEIGSLIGSLANRLGLAYFATVGATPSQIAQSFLRGSHLVAAISFPIYAGLAAVAPDAVPLIFGQAWSPAIPIVQIFSVVWSLVLARVLVAPLLRSISAQAELLLATALASLLTLVLVAPSASLGTVTLAVVLTLKHVAFIAVGFVLVRKYFKVGTRAQVSAIMRPLLAACAMLIGIAVLRATLADVSATVLVMATIALGAAVYNAVLVAIDAEYAAYASAILRSLRAALRRTRDIKSPSS